MDLFRIGRFCYKTNNSSSLKSYMDIKFYHRFPFLDFYKKVTGHDIPENSVPQLIKKHVNIDHTTEEQLQCSLQILQKFNITPYEACNDPHVFCMNPITMDNYGEILKECGFINIVPKHIIRYHSLVKSKTIKHLKKKGLMRNDYILEEVLQNYFYDWPANLRTLENFQDSNTSILSVRLSVLEKYLNWRLSVTPEQFHKYCRHYLPLKHRPISDIREALDIAQNDIKFDDECIRRNGFIISSDPIKTKLILENFESLAGMGIREAIKLEPAILKNNYKALLDIKNTLEGYRISEEAQRVGLKIYCMKSETVRQRLEELQKLKEFQVLETNPRVLGMVIHQKKMMSRLSRIQESKKMCYSLNHLISSSKVFNNYINSFGNKACGRDIATLITSSVKSSSSVNDNDEKTVKLVVKQLKRHKYYLHSALSVIDENLQFLKEKFENESIFNHCQLLLYPIAEIESYLSVILKLRDGEIKSNEPAEIKLDSSYYTLNPRQLTDCQILSLVLYEIEKKYHFSGDGIWARQDGLKHDVKPSATL